MKILLLLCGLFFISCSNDKDLALRDLDIILKDDMRVIVSGLDSKILLKKPVYKMVEVKWYENSKFSCNVKAEFYFLADSSCLIERKYRLNKDLKKWERYQNEYKLIEK